MKNILAFGDSLTWGADAASGGRHPFECRWPNALQAVLGDGVRVFAEGLNGRTTVFDDYSAATERNGAKLLPTILATHEPLDLVIIFLGTNDMRPHICGNAAGSAKGINRLIKVVKGFDYKPGYGVPKVLVISPPKVTPGADELYNQEMEGAVALSAQYATAYQTICEREGVHFFDAASVVDVDPIDGVHLTKQNTQALGQALAPVVKEILALN